MVVISNGFQKFHLTALAAELFRRGTLSGLLTGAYPASIALRLARSADVAVPKRLRRLLDRAEGIDPRLVFPQWLSEGLYQVGLRLPSQHGRESVSAKAMAWYSRRSATVVAELAASGAKVFHYRSGFGGPAVEMARARGMLTVCDHSILHPYYLSRSVERGRQYSADDLDRAVGPFWEQVVRDLETADRILVNSDFVRQSFLDLGYGEDRITTIYLGVDAQFMQYADAPRAGSPRVTRKMTFLFAASIADRRKGFHDLLDCFSRMPNPEWELRIAGKLSPEFTPDQYRVLEDPRIKLLGSLTREHLAREMREADVFILPTLAEGSARVVFEAMACGCAIVTTPSCGSVVVHGQHGWLVPSGNVDALTNAVLHALSNPGLVREVGGNNHDLVRTAYRQSHYGSNVLDYYRRSGAHLEQ